MNRWSLKEFFNVKDPEDNAAQYGAVMGANPLQAAYFLVWMTCPHLDPSTMSARIFVEYDVVFSQPVLAGAS